MRGEYAENMRRMRVSPRDFPQATPRPYGHMAMRGDFPLFCEYLLAVTLIGRTVMGSRNCLAFVHSWLPPAPNPTLCLQKLPKVYRIQSTDTKSSSSLIVTPIVTY